MSDNNLNGNDFSRGSEWRKWDLHIHTPKSIIQNYGGDTTEVWEKFILSLEHLPDDVKVIGINDYYFIDGYKEVMKFKKNGRLKNIDKIFPVLEFRIDTFASATESKFSKINLHILFDIDESDLDSEIKKIEDEFIGNINLSNNHETEKLSRKNLQNHSSDKKIKTGLVELIPDTKQVLKTINSKQWKKKTFTLLGYVEWNNLEKSTQLKLEKKELYKSANAFFTASQDDNINKKEEVLGFFSGDYERKALLHSGDVHSFDFLDTYSLDTSGKKKESKAYKCFTWIKAQPSFHGLTQIIFDPIERVKIQTIEPEKVADSYRIDRVEYTIDGKNKALVFNTYLNSVIGIRASGKSTLLKNIAHKIDVGEYDKKTQDGALLEIDEFKVVWADNEENNGTKDNKTILYIPQNFLSKLVHDSTTAKKELERFIRELFERNTKFKSKLSIWETSNQQLDKKIYDALSNLFDFDAKLNKTKDSIKKEGLSSDVSKNIKQIELNIEKVKEESKLTKKALNEYKTNKNNEAKYVVNLESINQDIDSLTYLLSAGLINLDVVDDLTFSLETEKRITKNLTEKRDDVTVFIKKEIITLETKSKKVKIDIETLRNKIKPVEDKMKKGSIIKELTDKLSENKNKLLRISKLDNEQKELYGKILSTKKSVLDLFLSREKLTDTIIKDFKDFGETFEFITIKIGKHFKKEEFVDFCKGINFHKVSIFKENKNDYKKAHAFLSKNEIKDVKDIYGIVSDLFINIFDENLPLIAGNNKKDFLLRLVSNWYDINYKDSVLNKDDNTKLLDMSDGQKMNALLELLFSFDDYSFPILIDQPEDDLDVTAITETVVKFIKEKKKQRQIILVSHNANLVIGSDTENIIVSEKKVKYRKIQGFEYGNGAIEDENIKSTVIKTLEGGKDAFKKRGKKLGIIYDA